MTGRFRAVPLAAVGVLMTAGVVVPGPTAAAPAPARYRVIADVQPDKVLVGRRVTITGSVSPLAGRAEVKLQVSDGSAWETVAVSGLSSRSRFGMTYLPPGAGDYLVRVRKPAQAGHRSGTSSTMPLTVTPELPSS